MVSKYPFSIFGYCFSSIPNMKLAIEKWCADAVAWFFSITHRDWINLSSSSFLTFLPSITCLTVSLDADGTLFIFLAYFLLNQAWSYKASQDERFLGSLLNPILMKSLASILTSYHLLFEKWTSLSVMAFCVLLLLSA